MSFVYYDKQGKPMSTEEQREKMNDRAYARVADDMLPNGYRVSTVWLCGIEHGFCEGKPVLFETMVFAPDALVCERYCTEEEALAGHKAQVARFSDPANESRFRLGDEDA